MDNISDLVERFFTAQKNKTIPYFDVDEIIQLIEHFLDEDDIDNLHGTLMLGHALHPNNLQIQIALISMLISLEEFDTALENIEKMALKENKELDFMRLECYCEGRRLSDALMFIDALKTENCPYFEDAVVYMAGLLNDSEHYLKDALLFINESLDSFPDNFLLRTELCYNYELQGKTKEALDLCCQLIDENSYSTDVWYMQGRLYAMDADFEKAIDSFDYALTCIEDDLQELEYEIKQMKAFCLYKNESYEKAISVYKELEFYDDFTYTEVNPFLAECYMNLDDYENAYHALKQIIGYKYLDDEVSVYGNFIYCCIETDRRNEALDTLTEALKYFPGNILEYLATLKIIKDPSFSHLAQKKKILTTGDLAREYLNNKFNYN